MAEQDGIIKLKGRIGDLTFFKTKDGYQARKVGGVTASRIANDPRFQRTRENMAEFGRAGKASKHLRTAFKALTNQLGDKKLSIRLTRAMLKVIQADAINDRGLRMVLDAETEMLTGFEFNEQSHVNSTLSVSYVSNIDRLSGIGKISFDTFSAKDMLYSPPGSTHFKFILAAALVDFTNETYLLDVTETAMLDVKSTNIPATILNCNLPPISTSPIFLLLGIAFYQSVNGHDYPLSNGAFNGLSIVNVNGV